MFQVIRKPIKRAGVIAGAAALIMSFIPGQAFATDEVPCVSSDYLQIWFHGYGDDNGTKCFANAGLEYPWNGNAVWIDKVSTGNNDVIFHDENGSDVYISRNNIVTYPNRPMQTNHFNIL